MKFAPTAKLAFLLAGVATFATAATAQTESVVYSFAGNAGLYSRLYEDDTGALYGAEYYGPSDKGGIYQLSEKKGAWSERLISKFSGNNGENPFGGLAQSTSGVLYGTTEYGGSYNLGTVFSLTPPGGKTWPESVLLDFNGGNGEGPQGDPIIGKTGALFGTAVSGGTKNCGTVFQLAQSGDNWTETTLYNFQGGSDGCEPSGALHTGGEEGILYGFTTYGGTDNRGTVFVLKESHGAWKEKILHTFTGGGDGSYPKDIDMDADENIYGVTYEGGTYDYGLVFELPAGGKPQETVLHDFEAGSDGSYPVGMHFDRVNGMLYGTTTYGGGDGAGTVFQLVGKGNSWNETILHSFGTSAYDGLYPQSRPLVDPTSGVLYGTTLDGGQYGGGTVWTVTP